MQNYKVGCTVVFESTVFPGATEEVCIPILEKYSSLKLNRDFGVGYSPERINPGDKNHRLSTVVKITSGSDTKTAEQVDLLYQQITNAGTYSANAIKVAEAAKVIENIQRDVNIALINELTIIFDKMNIATQDVLAAARTKWNFLDFQPGLVGGHCIGVDPFYLTYKAQEFGLNPELVLAGRRINDSMADFYTNKFIKSLLERRISLPDINFDIRTNVQRKLSRFAEFKSV